MSMWEKLYVNINYTCTTPRARRRRDIVWHTNKANVKFFEHQYFMNRT